MSADSPRRTAGNTSRGLVAVPSIVPPQVVSDRSILDSAIGFINEVTLAHQPHTDPKDTITWARFETAADISDPCFGEDWELDGNVSPPLLLILGYGLGVQVWAIPANGEAVEVLSWRHGIVSALRVLPTPSSSVAIEENGRADEPTDAFAEKRPLIALVDGSSSSGAQPQFCAVNFISLKTGTQVKAIKFKNPVIDVLANRSSIVITFHERIAVFDARTLEDRLSITTCYPSPGINPNPVALGPRWLAYAEHKLLHSKRSGGGCDGEGVASYTATVLNASKSLVKGLRELGEQVAAGLTGTSGSATSSKNTSFESGSGPDAKQSGIVTVIDIKNPLRDYSPTSGVPMSSAQSAGTDPIVAHFIAHSEALVAMEFDNSGMLLVTADRRGHDFHVFRVQPNPVGPSLAAVHHLYVLHRGDTSAKVQNISFSLDSRWVAVSTLRGTTHVFPITPYGGPMGVRTHTSLHVVNKLSRFHRSAGLSAEGRSNSPISHSESTTFSLSLQPYHNTTLPPYPRPTVVMPLAQLRQPFALGSPPGSATLAGGKSGPGGQGSGSQRQRLSSLSDDSGKPLSVCAIFAKSRSWLLDPPNVTREAPHRMQRKAVDSLFVMAGHGALIQYDLDTKLASNVAKEKICDDTPIELEVEAKAQWNLGRRKEGSQEIMPPLTLDNWLIKNRNSCMLTDSTRQYDDADDRGESWLAQVEIVTHAGPHRRLWMGPQFVFKTYNTPSGSNLSHVDIEAVEIGTNNKATSSTTKPEHSSPLNMPLTAAGRSSAVPVLIESGSYSSIEQSPKLMDRFRHDHLDSDYSVAHGDTRLKEDLADAMRESPSVSAASKESGGRGCETGCSSDNIAFYDALAEHDEHEDQDSDFLHDRNASAAALASALPNIHSYDNSSSYESIDSLKKPNVSIEKIVNPLGTVTTVTSCLTAEVKKDILDEVVSQLAAEDTVIHENCDESLFRPVVAIFCDEKTRLKQEEDARKQQELCQPPENISNKLIVPVIAKEVDDALNKKEKQKTYSKLKNLQSKDGDMTITKKEQTKFEELSSLNRKSKVTPLKDQENLEEIVSTKDKISLVSKNKNNEEIASNQSQAIKEQRAEKEIKVAKESEEKEKIKQSRCTDLKESVVETSKESKKSKESETTKTLSIANESESTIKTLTLASRKSSVAEENSKSSQSAIEETKTASKVQSKKERQKKSEERELVEKILTKTEVKESLKSGISKVSIEKRNTPEKEINSKTGAIKKDAKASTVDESEDDKVQKKSSIKTSAEERNTPEKEVSPKTEISKKNTKISTGTDELEEDKPMEFMRMTPAVVAEKMTSPQKTLTKKELKKQQQQQKAKEEVAQRAEMEKIEKKSRKEIEEKKSEPKEIKEKDKTVTATEVKATASTNVKDKKKEASETHKMKEKEVSWQPSKNSLKKSEEKPNEEDMKKSFEFSDKNEKNDDDKPCSMNYLKKSEEKVDDKNKSVEFSDIEVDNQDSKNSSKKSQEKIGDKEKSFEFSQNEVGRKSSKSSVKKNSEEKVDEKDKKKKSYEFSDNEEKKVDNQCKVDSEEPQAAASANIIVSAIDKTAIKEEIEKSSPLKNKTELTTKPAKTETKTTIKTEQLNVKDLVDSLIEMKTKEDDNELAMRTDVKSSPLLETVDIFTVPTTKASKKNKNKGNKSGSSSENEDVIEVKASSSFAANKSKEESPQLKKKSSTSSEDSCTDLADRLLERKDHDDMEETMFISFAQIEERKKLKDNSLTPEEDDKMVKAKISKETVKLQEPKGKEKVDMKKELQSEKDNQLGGLKTANKEKIPAIMKPKPQQAEEKAIAKQEKESKKEETIKEYKVVVKEEQVTKKEKSPEKDEGIIKKNKKAEKVEETVDKNFTSKDQILIDRKAADEKAKSLESKTNSFEDKTKISEDKAVGKPDKQEHDKTLKSSDKEKAKEKYATKKLSVAEEQSEVKASENVKDSEEKSAKGMKTTGNGKDREDSDKEQLAKVKKSSDMEEESDKDKSCIQTKKAAEKLKDNKESGEDKQAAKSKKSTEKLNDSQESDNDKLTEKAKKPKASEESDKENSTVKTKKATEKISEESNKEKSVVKAKTSNDFEESDKEKTDVKTNKSAAKLKDNEEDTNKKTELKTKEDIKTKTVVEKKDDKNDAKEDPKKSEKKETLAFETSEEGNKLKADKMEQKSRMESSGAAKVSTKQRDDVIVEQPKLQAKGRKEELQKQIANVEKETTKDSSKVEVVTEKKKPTVEASTTKNKASPPSSPQKKREENASKSEAIEKNSRESKKNTQKEETPIDGEIKKPTWASISKQDKKLNDGTTPKADEEYKIKVTESCSKDTLDSDKTTKSPNSPKKSPEKAATANLAPPPVTSAWKTLSGADMIAKNLSKQDPTPTFPTLAKGTIAKIPKTSSGDKLLPELPTPKELKEPLGGGGELTRTSSTKKTNSASALDDFPILKPLDALPPLPTLEPLELICESGSSSSSKSSNSKDISLINFESPLQENPALERKITPPPRGFTEHNLIFALCGSLHYENEQRSRVTPEKSDVSPTTPSSSNRSSSALDEPSMADYKSLTENDDPYISLEQSSQDTYTTNTNTTNDKFSSSTNSSGTEEIIIMEEKKMTKKQKRKRQQQLLELQKQKEQQLQQQHHHTTGDGEGDGDDDELRPLIAMSESQIENIAADNAGNPSASPLPSLLDESFTMKALIMKSNNALTQSTTTDSEGPMPATTSDDNVFIMPSSAVVQHKIKTKKLEHKINLMAAIEAATSSSTSSAEESGVELGCSLGRGGSHDVDDVASSLVPSSLISAAGLSASATSSVLPMSMAAVVAAGGGGSSACAAPMSLSSNTAGALKKKTKRRKR